MAQKELQCVKRGKTALRRSEIGLSPTDTTVTLPHRNVRLIEKTTQRDTLRKTVSGRTTEHNAITNPATKHLPMTAKTLTMAEWAREVGIKYTTLRARIRRGIPFEKAIEQ